MHRRFALVLALLCVSCGGKKAAEDAPVSLGFAPKDADTVLRLDLVRARAWSGWAKASPIAFQAVQPAISAVKSSCGIDLLGEASAIVLARRGVGATADMTLVIRGLPRAKTEGCAAKLGSTIPGVEIAIDGDRFRVLRGGKPFASGARVGSTGDVVIVSRGGTAPDPEAWRSEVQGGWAPVPAWWSELDHEQPLAVRLHSPEHTITASAQLADPFVVRGKVVTASAQAAQVDLARMKAIVEFLTRAGAGTGRLEPQDNVIYGDFTATGKEIDSLVAAGLSAIGSDPSAAPPPAGNTTPIACTELRGAVSAYLKASLDRMTPEERGVVEATIAKLEKHLGDAYVDTCTLDAWSPEIIHCHVDNAKMVSRFEKCRMLVAEEPRKKFDERVKAALEASR